MSRPKRSRQSWPPEVRARALEIGREKGAAAASEATGVSAGTIRSWLQRDGHASSVTPEIEASDLEAKPPEAMDIDAWINLQRLVEAKMQRALMSGSPSDARWFAISLGVVTDKLAKAREAAPGSVDSDLARRAHQMFERARDGNADELRAHLASVYDSILVRRVHAFAALSIDELRPFRIALTERIAQLTEARRFLLEEEIRRRRGATSLFAGVHRLDDVPEPFRSHDLPSPSATWSAPSELPGVVLPPERHAAPIDVQDDHEALERLVEVAELKLAVTERQERAAPAADESIVLPLRPSRWAGRRSLGGWQGPRRGLDARRDHPNSPKGA